MGGSIDAYGDVDYSEIAATALSRHWAEMLDLVADVALRPTLPDGTVRRCAISWSGRSGTAATSPTTSPSTPSLALFGPRQPLRLGPDRAEGEPSSG